MQVHCYHLTFDGIFDGINSYTAKHNMTRLSNKLTAKAVKNLSYDTEGSNKYADGSGLYLLITANGSKHWRMDYRRPVTQKRNTLALGTYPVISLEEARIKRDDAKKMLMNGIDPAEDRNANKEKKKAQAENVFSRYVRDWLDKRAIEGRKDAENIRMLNIDILPYIGDMPITLMTPEQLEKDVTNRIVARGAIIVAIQAKKVMKMVLNIPLKKRLIQYNPAENISLPRPQKGNNPAITGELELTFLLKKIWSYTEDNHRNYKITELAIKLAVYIFQRPNEVRGLLWEHVDFDKGYLTFTASKTKQPHIVPLSSQAYEILKQIQEMNTNSIYVFPSPKNNAYCLSPSTMGGALKRMGFGGKQTAHGFRATARTLLDEELDTRSDIIEHQLAHKVKDPNGTAYNRTKFLNKRQKMMQVWADYLDALRLDQDVSRFKPQDDEMDNIIQFTRRESA